MNKKTIIYITLGGILLVLIILAIIFSKNQGYNNLLSKKATTNINSEKILNRKISYPSLLKEKNNILFLDIVEEKLGVINLETKDS